MTLQEFARIFNRALSLSFSKRKNLFLFSVLALVGTLFLFFRLLAAHQERWLQNTLLFVPFFFGMGIILAAQVLVTRIYSEERKGNKEPFRKVLFTSLERMLKISYLSIPLFLTYLLFWILSSLFLLLSSIPLLGTFLKVVLAFAPYVLNLGAICLGLVMVLLSFFVCPTVALEDRIDRRALVLRLKDNIFMNLLFFILPLLSVLLLCKVLLFAAYLTVGRLPIEESSLETTLESFFMMFPFIALLAPALNFFFNFAVEAYAVYRK
ncbi:MAG: hypothetical protein ACKVOH_04875 [Chlamydiales bacterium]